MIDVQKAIRRLPAYAFNVREPAPEKTGETRERPSRHQWARRDQLWGVYGVPETFVIYREGRIAYKHIGPITSKLLDEKLRPLIEKLRQ